jgi:hypothetical protein
MTEKNSLAEYDAVWVWMFTDISEDVPASIFKVAV